MSRLKFLSINRTVQGDTGKSSLVLGDGVLTVLGNLPHNATITFEKEEAEKLIKWLQEYYGGK